MLERAEIREDNLFPFFSCPLYGIPLSFHPIQVILERESSRNDGAVIRNSRRHAPANNLPGILAALLIVLSSSPAGRAEPSDNKTHLSQ